MKNVERLAENKNYLSPKDELFMPIGNWQEVKAGLAPLSAKAIPYFPIENGIKWFESHHLANHFVIIDDDKSLNALPPLVKKLVLTSGLIGLTEELANEAIAALSNKEPSVA